MKRSLFFFLSLLAVLEVSAEEADTLKFQVDEALQINISYRILPLDTKTTFQDDSSELMKIPTIPGNPVTIWLKGTNIIIQAVLTPYSSKDGKLLLVAQGQVWYSDPSVENEVKVLSSYKSIVLAMGERIFFFPLGIPKDMNNSELFNIALEIEIVPFESQ